MNDETDLRRYLGVLVRRKWVVLIVFLLAVAIGTILSFVVPRIYEANLLLFPGSYTSVSQSFTPPSPLSSSQGQFTTNLYGYPRVLTEVLQSDAFVHETVERLGLLKDAASLRVRAQWIPDSLLVRLTVRAGVPGVAQRVSEALAASVIQKSNESTEPLRRTLNRMLDQVRAEAPLLAQVAAEARKFAGTALQREHPTAEELHAKALALEALASAEATYQTSLDRERMLLYQISEVQPVRVIGAGRAAEVQVVPSRRLDIMVAGLLGLLAGVLAAFAAEGLAAPARTPTGSGPLVRT
jgi:uncharacterized protein involved in exopolysaccharide biosynthesis